MRQDGRPLLLERILVPDAAAGRQGYLLLEQRWKHESGAPAIFEALHAVEIPTERARAGDERMRQPESEHRRRGIHEVPRGIRIVETPSPGIRRRHFIDTRGWSTRRAGETAAQT